MSERVLSLSAVREATSLGRTAIYSAQKAGLFPKAIHLTARRRGWLESEILGWVADRASERAA